MSKSDSESIEIAKAVAGELSGLSTRSPLLFSIVACVFAIGGTVIACVVLLHDPPITKQALDDVLRPYAKAAETLSKQQFDAEVTQRNATSERFFDNLKSLQVSLERMDKSRAEDKADIKNQLNKIEQDIAEQRTRVDRVLERAVPK